MIRILLDDELRKKLHHLREPVELVDPLGGVVGRISIEPTNRMEEPSIEPDELVGQQNDPGMTTEELMAHLRAI